MISRKCCAPFLWLALIAINSIRCPFCQAKAETGDKQTSELAPLYTEIPQSDMAVPNSQITKNDRCYRFSVPDFEKMEFYSPGFEDEKTYTNSTDCVLQLSAPSGKILRLDFRDYFEIEPSAGCKNDYLEVRDGKHGYNDLIKPPFCGFEFPPMLQSTDRYLWIHFRSDDSIEYRGFKAVFEYIDRPDTGNPEIMDCQVNLTHQEEGNLSRSDIPAANIEFAKAHKMNTDCIWAITVRENWRIQLQFKKFTLKKPNECEKNFVEVFSSKPDIPSRERKFCGSIADSVFSKSHVMYVRFFADHETLADSTFEANFTAFRDSNKSPNSNKPACRKDEFDCDDATCISATLKCNGRYNCRFRWDEDNCQSVQSLSLTDDHIIVIMVIFSLILSGMCFTFIFNCIKKLIRDHKTIQEYIRQSREQQLNELDKQEPTDKKLGKSRSRSNSSHSTNSGHFDVANAATTPCYVPGGELLPILIRNERSMSPPNGDAYHTNIYTVDNEVVPEMCDSACQTRESLFTTQGYSSGNSTPNHSVHTNSPPAPFSTFGYKKDTKFKAEAKIEVAPRKPKVEDKRRPYSVQTTKSAPDVIVTH